MADTCFSIQLEQALEISERDVKDASTGVLEDLKRFQAEKEDDLKRYMVSLYCTTFPSPPFPDFGPALLTSLARICPLPYRLGEKEYANMGGGPRSGGEY